MWNRTGQSDQEVMGPSSQHHSSHSSNHPPQPIQPITQDKSCTSGKLKTVCSPLIEKCRLKTNFIAVITSNLMSFVRSEGFVDEKPALKKVK